MTNENLQDAVERVIKEKYIYIKLAILEKRKLTTRQT